jgi:hypothetical protein
MTYDKLKKAECLRDEIHEANIYLRYIKHYEHQLFSYGMEVVIPQCVGTFGVNNKMYFYDKQLKKDLLNTIKIHLIQKIQNTEKELEEL